MAMNLKHATFCEAFEDSHAVCECRQGAEAELSALRSELATERAARERAEQEALWRRRENLSDKKERDDAKSREVQLERDLKLTRAERDAAIARAEKAEADAREAEAALEYSRSAIQAYCDGENAARAELQAANARAEKGCQCEEGCSNHCWCRCHKLETDIENLKRLGGPNWKTLCEKAEAELQAERAKHAMTQSDTQAIILDLEKRLAAERAKREGVERRAKLWKRAAKNLRWVDGGYVRDTNRGLLRLLNDALAAEREKTRKLESLACFFRSVIESGEGWTETCEKSFHGALAREGKSEND